MPTPFLDTQKYLGQMPVERMIEMEKKRFVDVMLGESTSKPICHFVAVGDSWKVIADMFPILWVSVMDDYVGIHFEETPEMEYSYHNFISMLQQAKTL